MVGWKIDVILFCFGLHDCTSPVFFSYSALCSFFKCVCRLVVFPIIVINNVDKLIGNLK